LILKAFKKRRRKGCLDKTHPPFHCLILMSEKAYGKEKKLTRIEANDLVLSQGLRVTKENVYHLMC